MAKVTVPEKKGFTPYIFLKNFLYGLKDTAHSKVYVRIEEKNNKYYLCVYLDNNYPSDILEHENGFRKHYEFEMNEVDYDALHIETIQDITVQAYPEIAQFHEEEGFDSREILSMFRDWAKEFEAYWLTKSVSEESDYYEEIEEFTDKKVIEYKEIHS